MSFVCFGLLPLQPSLLVHELAELVIVLACEVAGWIRFHLVVVPSEGTEAVGVVSLVEHLHGRSSNDQVYVSSPMIKISLLFSVLVENRRYCYRLFLLQESQDRLDGSVTHAELLREERDLYRSFLAMHTYPVGNDGETFARGWLSHFPQGHSAVLSRSDVHEAVVVLRFVVVSDYGWVFLSHFSSVFLTKSMNLSIVHIFS